MPVGFVPSEPRPEQESIMLPVGLHLLGNHWEDHKVRIVCVLVIYVLCICGVYCRGDASCVFNRSVSI